MGGIFTTTGKDLWRLDNFVPEPWARFVRIDYKGDGIEKQEGMTSELPDFVRLVPEQEPPKRLKRAYHRKGQPSALPLGIPLST